ncbi:hypothetical protein JCM19237_6731 [Photobacterium aphoticum]|uniref:Uncharacterized protein n=1 Tax=Photobacterium aphoticum TaxID=754436 RepID=A0A090R897_9GAMM|nr:hypothetical protein JCM19237_6731 [Photobacterium aphoticum]
MNKDKPNYEGGLSGNQMMDTYSLDSGWAIERYEYEATALKALIDAEHVKITNLHEFVNN